MNSENSKNNIDNLIDLINSVNVNSEAINNSSEFGNESSVSGTINNNRNSESSELSVEIFKKFCQDKQSQERKRIGVGSSSETEEALSGANECLTPFSDSLMQFGNLLTCDLVVQHLGRQYFSHKSALSSILDMNALGIDAFVVEYKRSFIPYLDKTVEIFTINEQISLYHLAQFLFYGYYRRFAFEQFYDNRVAEFMTEIVTEHGSSVSETSNDILKTSISSIYEHYLKDVFVTPKKVNSTEDFKQRLIEMLHISVKFKVVLIIDEILDLCDFRIDWFEMFTPFSKLKCGGALGRVKEKVLNNIEKNFEEMIEADSTDYMKHIEEFSYEDLASLLKKDTLRVSNEMQVWRVFYVWALAHPNRTAEIRDFVCNNLRYGLLLQNEIKEIFSALFALLPKDVYQSIYINLCKNYTLINSLICQGKLVCYKNRILGDAHHATRLRKFTEVVLILGGWMVGTQSNFVECFVPSLDLLFDIVEFPMFDMGAYFASEFIDNHLYIYGGSARDTLSNSCMSLNFNETSKYKWKKLKNMTTNRCYIASCVYRNRLVALGGFDGRERLNTVECFDPIKNMWIAMPKMTHARSDACAVVLNDRIYVAGGINTNCIEHTIEMYDPDKKKWISCADMLIPRTSFAMVVFKGRIWAIGGNSGTRRVSSVDSYDPVTNTWQIEANMNEPRSTFKATVFRNHIYVFGGYNGGGPLSTVERYNPDTAIWTIENHLHFDRSGHSVVYLPYEAASKFDIPLVKIV